MPRRISGRLVCYDCGVACDLTKMREDRLVALRIARGGGRRRRRRPRRGHIAGGSEQRDGASAAADRRRRPARAGRQQGHRSQRARAPRRACRRGHRIHDVSHSVREGRARRVPRPSRSRALLARSFRRADSRCATTRGLSTPSADHVRPRARPRHPEPGRAHAMSISSTSRRASRPGKPRPRRRAASSRPTRCASGSRACARRASRSELRHRALAAVIR